MKHRFKFWLMNDFFNETHVTTTKSNNNEKYTIQYQFKVVRKSDTLGW